MLDFAIFWDWLSFAVRWLHVITGIAWIGSSFYFVALDLGLRQRPGLPAGAFGEEWQVHGGGFYNIQKYLVAPAEMPEHLTWFKWESYATWLSGFAMLAIVYYAGADLFLVDRNVLDVSAPVAILISLASLALGWLIYDQLCKSPLSRNDTLLMLVLYAVVVFMAWAYTQLFTGRAAFLHLGAFTATIMSANVFMVIIPNQKIVVADLIAGRTPDPKYGKIAKTRSTHNNYLTLPVLFLMLSNHYPLAFGTQFNWVIASLVFIIGVLIRHYFNSTHARKGNPTWTWLVAAILFVIIIWLSTVPKVLTGEQQVAAPNEIFVASTHFPAVRDTVMGRCAMCHASEPSYEGIYYAPKGVVLESDAGIADHAREIYLQAGRSHAMPPGNVTQITPEERALLVTWYEEAGNSTGTILRGRTLTFLRRPDSTDDHGAFRYEEDGGLLVRDGRIAATGGFAEVKAEAGDGATVIDHRPHLLLPGFIDCHVHIPQMQVIASYGSELLDWLNKYTFPEETKFRDAQHSRRIARLFLDEMVRQGTTTVAAYCSVHRQSAEAFFAELHGRNMLNIAGKVMMDRNAPEGVLDTPQSGYDDSKALIAEWHGKGRQHYAITPRFAITSTPEQMEMAQALMREHPGLHMQTHLSENHAEIAFTQQLYPWSRDYTDVYERYGLLGPRSLFGHCIHLTEREADAMSDTGSVAVFCPTSNLFLGSGLFDYQRYRRRQKPVRIAAATDVGGGTNYSMLRTMDEGYKVIALNGEKLNPLASFWQLTRGNAEALSFAERIGTLEPGSDADITVLDARATPAMRLRMETVTTLAEELFLLQTLGDDRSVAEVYVAGRPAKSDLLTDPVSSTH